MRTEEEIRKELETTTKVIKENLIEIKKELDQGHPITAIVNESYHTTLQGYAAALLWVLKEKR